jgi:citrate lyase subunit beta/citryl-CoA lyase
VNPPRTPWCHVELAELAAAPAALGSVVIPKVESAGDLAFVERLLDGTESAERHQPLRVQALIESARGIVRLNEIAGSSPRLSSLILGYADLGGSLGRPGYGPANLDLWLDVQNAVLITARVHDLQAIDGPFLGTADDAQFRAAAQRARDLGFDGKWAIHPSQLQALNDMFTPSAEELEQALAIVEALARAESDQNAGAVSLNGTMIDEAVRKSALRVLARGGRAAHRGDRGVPPR